jgi:tetratricopeptide (TPR) repeat protein
MKIKPIYILILLIVITSILSSVLYNSLLNGKDNYTSDNLNAIFGSTRKAISSYFYDKADVYFHRGIVKSVVLEDDPDDQMEHAHNDAEDHHEEEDHHHHADVKIPHTKNPIANFYAYMQRATVPSGHFHRSGEDAKEILPWIYLAVKIDPANDELYRTIAYWLQQSYGRPDLSIDMYNLAQQNLPYNPAIKLEQGMLLMNDNQQAEAMQKFQAALKFINMQPKDEQDPYLKVNILLEIASIYEKQGNTAKTLEAYEQIHPLFPERQSTIDKIKQLKNEI